MVTPEKFHILKTAYPYMVQNLGEGLNNIIFVANSKYEADINSTFANEPKVIFLDEEKVMDGLNIEHIREILRGLCGKDFRAGWFFQQFLKMAYSYICKDDYYLVFDSDTIPLHPIQYFSDNGKPNFITKIEYHKPYFETIDRLFNGRVGRVNVNESFIAENMIINKKIMIRMIEDIMTNDKLFGDSFYEKALNAVDKEFVKYTGFSEFETYGNYVMTYYPEEYGKIKIRTQRLGAFLLGDDPDEEQLKWAANDYDIISFEPFGRRWLTKKTKQEAVRSKYTAKELFKKYIKLSNFLDRITFKKVIRYDE